MLPRDGRIIFNLRTILVKMAGRSALRTRYVDVARAVAVGRYSSVRGLSM